MSSFQFELSSPPSDASSASGESVDDQEEARGERAGPRVLPVCLAGWPSVINPELNHAVLKRSVVDLWDQQL